MKHKGFRRLALFMALLLLFSSMPLSVFAANASPYLRTEDKAVAYVESYANDISTKREKYHVVAKTPIQSFTSGKSYVVYTFDPGGYAIYDEVSGVVEEMMLDAKNPYSGIKNKNLFYGGPMNYIAEVDGKYISLLDNHELQKTDITYLAEMEQSTVNNRAATKAVPTTSTTYTMNNSRYFTTLLDDDFGYNVSGSCLAIACAITLGFYDYYVNDQFVPTAYESNYGTTESFHQLMRSFVGYSGSSASDGANGLNNYFASIYFYSPDAYYEDYGCDAVYSRVCNNVYNNKPTIILMNTDFHSDCTMNHFVVAYGYREELRGAELISASYFVHNGWHDSKLGTYAWDWFWDDLYIS